LLEVGVIAMLYEKPSFDKIYFIKKSPLLLIALKAAIYSTAHKSA